MEMIIAPIILIGLVFYVAVPLLLEKSTAQEVKERTALEVSLEDKENILANLKDIEMDFRMGKLSDEDYWRLREEFEQQAVGILERIEQLSKREKKSKP
jgi:hypothetical protein